MRKMKFQTFLKKVREGEFECVFDARETWAEVRDCRSGRVFQVQFVGK